MGKEISMKVRSSKAQFVIFRITNLILIIGMLAGGITVLLRIDYQVQLFTHLGYPLFLMSMIGVGKILAAIILMLPRLPLLKVGAYVGTFIVSICAFISHIIAGDGASAMNPLVLTGITLTACLLNPNIKFVQDQNHH